MTPNVDITPVMIQINSQIIGKFLPIFQLKIVPWVLSSFGRFHEIR